ncbi:hypothetical protein ACFQ3L_01040 [Lacticaseibacillus jixianensis]|uniref:Uncharacterized protein n=1 Tax=Lacticaseibacillus jixianensis TaxID=2486012 RepID=A0ABW4B760_9LACO|nr:hypothetical protein [Lacticaseibacillus jixianensis]
MAEATDGSKTARIGVDYLLTFTEPQSERAVRLALNPVVAYLREYQGGYRFSSNMGPTSLKVRLKHALNLDPRTFTLRSTSAAFDKLY